MRILYVISDSNIGGAGILLCNILRHINRERFSCAVAMPYGSDLRARVLELGVRVIETDHPVDRFSWQSVRELCEIVRDFDATVVHTNAAVCARVAGKLCGRRVVHTRHCYYPIKPDGDPIVGAVRRLGNRMLSDRAIATASAAARNLEQLGIPKSRIRVIINGSEPVREVAAWELEEWRARLNLREEDFCIGICARLEPCKGHETFLRAAAILCSKMPEKHFRFLIVGDGSRRAELERMGEKLGISQFLRFTGFVSDVAPLYRLFRINVNCSCGTETSCLAISEGMSAALPTVASDYGGNAAMLGDGESGICFPVGDAKALAEALQRIASDVDLEATMSIASKKRYLERFTPERMINRLEQVYAALQ